MTNVSKSLRPRASLITALALAVIAYGMVAAVPSVVAVDVDQRVVERATVAPGVITVRNPRAQDSLVFLNVRTRGAEGPSMANLLKQLELTARAAGGTGRVLYRGPLPQRPGVPIDRLGAGESDRYTLTLTLPDGSSPSTAYQPGGMSIDFLWSFAAWPS